jgi:molybdate transport system permease protein
MEHDNWQIIYFTLGVSVLSTFLILPGGVFLAWLLARPRWIGKSFVETLVALPLVVPPVATGLILLKLFGRRGFIGSFLERNLGVEVVFTWRAVVIALGVMSFPLLVRTSRVAFEEINPRLEEIARTLGAGETRIFFTLALPLAARGILAGTMLAFARALGEFGATIMVAGNIPGRTSTIALSIYQYVQLGQDSAAYRLLGFSVLMAFGAVWLSEFVLRRRSLSR